MTAPTEDEVRAAVLDALTSPASDSLTRLEALGQVIDDVASIVRAPAWDVLECPDPRDPAQPVEGLWRDLRPSEAGRLMELYGHAVTAASMRCEAVVVEELTAAGVRFAREFPGAPRAAETVQA